MFRRLGQRQQQKQESKKDQRESQLNPDQLLLDDDQQASGNQQASGDQQASGAGQEFFNEPGPGAGMSPYDVPEPSRKHYPDQGVSRLDRLREERQRLGKKLDRAYGNNYEGYTYQDQSGEVRVNIAEFDRDKWRYERLGEEIEEAISSGRNQAQRIEEARNLLDARANAVLSHYIKQVRLPKDKQSAFVNYVKRQLGTIDLNTPEYANASPQELQLAIDNLVMYVAQATYGAMLSGGQIGGGQAGRGQGSRGSGGDDGQGLENVDYAEGPRDDGFGENDHARAIFKEIYEPQIKRKGKTVRDRLNERSAEVRKRFGVRQTHKPHDSGGER